jgi:hypothetical protein
VHFSGARRPPRAKGGLAKFRNLPPAPGKIHSREERDWDRSRETTDPSCPCPRPDGGYRNLRALALRGTRCPGSGRGDETMTRRPINLSRLTPLRRGFVLGFMRAKRQSRKELRAMAQSYDDELVSLQRNSTNSCSRTIGNASRPPSVRLFSNAQWTRICSCTSRPEGEHVIGAKSVGPAFGGSK